jgi:hypothetical protein
MSSSTATPPLTVNNGWSSGSRAWALSAAITAMYPIWRRARAWTRSSVTTLRSRASSEVRFFGGVS